LVGRKNASYSVDYDIAVPSDAPLLVKNSFGNVNASGVRSKSEFDNSHGSLNVRDTGSARLTNSFGSIELNGASGDVSVTDNNGSVQVLQVKGALEVRNRFGSITVRDIGGAATSRVETGSHCNGGRLRQYHTSFGSVEARNVHGDLMVTTITAISTYRTLAAPQTSPTALETSRSPGQGSSELHDQQRTR